MSDSTYNCFTKDCVFFDNNSPYSYCRLKRIEISKGKCDNYYPKDEVIGLFNQHNTRTT